MKITNLSLRTLIPIEEYYKTGMDVQNLKIIHYFWNIDKGSDWDIEHH